MQGSKSHSVWAAAGRTMTKTKARQAGKRHSKQPLQSKEGVLDFIWKANRITETTCAHARKMTPDGA